MRRPKSREKNSYSIQAGIVLFLVGVIGFLYWYGQSRYFHLDDFLSSDTQYFFQVQQFDRIKETDYPGVRDLLSAQLKQDFYQAQDLDLGSWVGDSIGVAHFKNDHRIWAFSHTKSDHVQRLLRSFLVEDERFGIIKYSRGEVWSPTFSSNVAFGFSGKWFFMATDHETLKAQFRGGDKLRDREDYKKLQKDLPSKGMVRAFLDLRSWVKTLGDNPRFLSKKPLLEALGE